MCPAWPVDPSWFCQISGLTGRHELGTYQVVLHFPDLRGEHDRQLAQRGIDRLPSATAAISDRAVLRSGYGAQNL